MTFQTSFINFLVWMGRTSQVSSTRTGMAYKGLFKTLQKCSAHLANLSLTFDSSEPSFVLIGLLLDLELPVIF